MEVSLTPGNAAFVINFITFVLGSIAVPSLIVALNGCGRWRLYRDGKVNMNMHFQYMGLYSAFQSSIRHRKGSRTVFLFFCLEAAIFLALSVLSTIAPLGISESKNVRVERSFSARGQSLCREHQKTTAGNVLLGLATERIRTHFAAGGGILRVGRTARNKDALIMEDEIGSLGELKTLNERTISTRIRIGYNMSEPEMEPTFLLFENGANFSPRDTRIAYSFGKKTHPSAVNQVQIQETEGPLYMVGSLTKPFSGSEVPEYVPERYAFVICDVPKVSLSYGEDTTVDARCNIATFERNVAKSGSVEGIFRDAYPLELLSQVYGDANMSTLGQRCVMVIDTAIALDGRPCGDTYMAYLPLSKISTASIAVICSLGAITLVCVISAVASTLFTKGTLDWNGSYLRFIGLLANSDSIGLSRWDDVKSLIKADVVVERSESAQEAESYQIHVVGVESESNPVAQANPKLIQ